MRLTLHGYWRSGAAWRVRIALGLKRLEWTGVAHDLRTGAQGAESYRIHNPQALVPALDVDGTVITQSLAIIAWLDETFPEPPLLPRDPLARAKARAMALCLAADTHPLHNLRVLQALRRDFAADEAHVTAWIGRWIGDGLDAFSRLAAATDARFCHGDAPGLADCCLVPQLYAARRFGVDPARWPALVAIEARCGELPAFAAARPEAQPDCDA